MTHTTLTKFQTIALPLVERGFWVTPVRPDAKAGVGGFNHWWYRTQEDVLTLYVEKYAGYNAGIVSRRGIGNEVFVDNDGGIPQDVISRFPKTYTVASRPNSVHQHHYFTQTVYSLDKFGRDARNINIKDVSQIVPAPRGGVMYKTLFDVKGIGGASFVVAAGSVKPNGDVYTVIDDSPIAEIPPWVVDWILEQQRNYRIAKTLMMRKHFKEKKRAAGIPPAERERLRALGHPDGFDICAVDRRDFTFSQAFKLARLGIVGDALVEELIRRVERHVEGGVAYCELSHAEDSIRGIARHAEQETETVYPKGLLDFYGCRGRKWLSEGTVIYNGDNTDELPVLVRKDALREIIHAFPDVIANAQADTRLAEGLSLLGLEPYDKRRDKNAVSLIRKDEHFEVGRGHWMRHKG